MKYVNNERPLEHSLLYKSPSTMSLPLIKISMLCLLTSDHFSTQNSLFVPVWIARYMFINSVKIEMKANCLEFGKVFSFLRGEESQRYQEKNGGITKRCGGLT